MIGANDGKEALERANEPDTIVYAFEPTRELLVNYLWPMTINNPNLKVIPFAVDIQNSLGAEVHCVEGRQENVDRIKNDYTSVTVQCANLDTPDWNFGYYDIIINFGLYYHLENFHKEHLVNCVNNCNLMFFETVIYDSFEDEIYFREEAGNDQSLTPIGGTPSTSYIMNKIKLIIFDLDGVLVEAKKYITILLIRHLKKLMKNMLLLKPNIFQFTMD
jgi:hypothetical protein